MGVKNVGQDSLDGALNYPFNSPKSITFGELIH
jgi:hypothetical protein